MAVMDEFKEQREALKNGTPKEKLGYFWYYYKWHVIGTLFAIFLIIFFVYEMVSRKETIFNVAMVNASDMAEITMEGESQFPQKFADYVGIDTDTYDVLFDVSYRIAEDGADETSMVSSQKLFAYTAAGQLDVMLTDSTSFRKYANAYNFYDVREILSEAQLAKYEPYFYYVDETVMEAIDIAANNLEDTSTIEIPDPTKPENMEKPLPVGIFVDNDLLMEEYYFRGEDIVIGIYQNTQHLDYALGCIDFLYEEVTAE